MQLKSHTNLVHAQPHASGMSIASKLVEGVEAFSAGARPRQEIAPDDGRPRGGPVAGRFKAKPFAQLNDRCPRRGGVANLTGRLALKAPMQPALMPPSGIP